MSRDEAPWLMNRYRKEWYVATLASDGRTAGVSGPFTWHTARRIRDLQGEANRPHVTVISRTP